MTLDIYRVNTETLLQLQKNHFLYISFLGRKRNKFYVGKHSCAMGIHHPKDNRYHGSSHDPVFKRFMRMFGRKAIQTYILETFWTEDECFAREAEIVDLDFIMRSDVINLQRGGKGQNIMDWATQRRRSNPALPYYDVICSMKAKRTYWNKQILETVRSIAEEDGVFNIEMKHIQGVITYGIRDGVLKRTNQKDTKRAHNPLYRYYEEIIQDYLKAVNLNRTAERMSVLLGYTVSRKDIYNILDSAKLEGRVPSFDRSEQQRRGKWWLNSPCYEFIIELKKQHYPMHMMIDIVSKEFNQKATRPKIMSAINVATEEGLLPEYTISESIKGQRPHICKILHHYDLVVQRKKEFVPVKDMAVEISAIEGRTVTILEVKAVVAFAKEDGVLPTLKVGEAVGIRRDVRDPFMDRPDVYQSFIEIYNAIPNRKYKMAQYIAKELMLKFGERVTVEQVRETRRQAIKRKDIKRKPNYK